MEDVVVGRTRVEVVADMRPLRRDLRQVQAEAKQSGRATEEAFAGGAREADTFSARVRSVIMMLVGVAGVVVDRVSGAFRGFWGLVGRVGVSLADVGTVGAVMAARGMRALAETTRDANGELSAMGKATVVAADGLERVARAASWVANVILGAKIAAGLFVAKLTVDFLQAAHAAQSEFAPAMQRVRTLLQDMPQDTFKRLSSDVSNLAGDRGIKDATIAANALYIILSNYPELARDTGTALQFLDGALKVEASGFGTAEQAVKSASAILRAFNLDAAQATQVMDDLFQAQDAGEVEFGDIAGEIGSVAAVVASLGGSYKDVLGILAALTPTGRSASEILTGLQSALGNLLAPSEAARQAAREMNLDISAQTIAVKGLNGVLLELIERTNGNPEVLRKFFPDREGLNLMLLLTGQTDALQKAMEGINDTGERTNQIFATMNATWARQSEILDSQLQAELRATGAEFEGLGMTALRIANSIVGAYREVAGVVRRVRQAMAEAAGNPAAAGGILGMQIGQWWANRNRPAPPAQLAPVRVTSDRPLPEPATIEYARQKIDDYRASLQALAVAQHARTGDAAAYEVALDRTREKVNGLVLSEMERLRAAGVAQVAVNELAGLYEANLSDYRKGNREAETARRRAEREAAADLKRDLAELEKARERHATALDREIKQLREWAETAAELKQNGLAEQLRQEARELELYGTTLGEWADKLQAVVSGTQILDGKGRGRLFDPGRLADPFGAALKEVEPQLGALTLAYETAMSEAQERLAARAISRDDFERAGRAAAEEFNAGLFAVLEQLEAEDIIPPQVLNEVRNRFKNTENQEPRRDTATQAREYGAVARAVLQAADAFGALDDGVRNTLESAISLAETIGSIDFSKVKVTERNGERIVSGGLSVAGTAALVSGMAGLATAFVEWGQRRREAELALLQQISRNSRALEAFRERELRDVSQTEREGLLEQGTAFERRYGEAINAMLAMGRTSGYVNGMTPEQVEFLNRLEELTGAEFFDQKTGELQFEEFRKALEAFRTGELGGFGDDLTGELDRLDFLFQHAGDAIGDANAKMAAFLQTVRQFSPQFADEFERILKEQGPAAARAWLEAQVLAYGTGGVGAVAHLFGPNVTAEDIERIFGASDTRLSDVESGNSATQNTSYQTTKSITEVTGHKLYSALVSIVYLLRQIYTTLSGKTFELPVPPPDTPITPATPALPPTGGPDPIPAGGSTGGAGAGAGGGGPVEPPARTAADVVAVPELVVGRLVVESLRFPHPEQLLVPGQPALRRLAEATPLHLPTPASGAVVQQFGDVRVEVPVTMAPPGAGLSPDEVGGMIARGIRQGLSTDTANRQLGRTLADSRRARGGRPNA
ncbi:MAG: phage tail tape measure protein [Gemmatimonadota bacterium]